MGATGFGILMVGAAVGLGGKLMRTVSFLGWIFALSDGLGGTAPAGGTGGVVSAIKTGVKLRRGAPGVNVAPPTLPPPAHCLGAVIMGKSSVRNGEAGRPASLKRFTTG